MIIEDHIEGFRRVTLAHDGLVVAVLPELGGKIEMLRRAGSDRNALLAPARPYRKANYGASFEDYDTSGFDECFPTVAACKSPDEPKKLLPDHGELWSAEWTCEAEGENTLCMEAGGVNVPYRFRRRLTIEGETLRLDYELVSESDHQMRVLWSAHPLLAVSEGSRIFLPPEVHSLFVNWSAGERLGKFGDSCAWPRADDASGRRLDVIGSRGMGTADKLFTERLHQGFCAFHDRASDESIIFRFDPNQTPYLGLWICQGGWPTTAPAEEGHYTVALEPCSGRPDSLAEAAQRDECVRLKARETKHWWLEISLRAGAPTSSLRGIE